MLFYLIHNREREREREVGHGGYNVSALQRSAPFRSGLWSMALFATFSFYHLHLFHLLLWCVWFVCVCESPALSSGWHSHGLRWACCFLFLRMWRSVKSRSLTSALFTSLRLNIRCGVDSRLEGLRALLSGEADPGGFLMERKWFRQWMAFRLRAVSMISLHLLCCAFCCILCQ